MCVGMPGEAEVSIRSPGAGIAGSSLDMDAENQTWVLRTSSKYS